MCRTQISNSDVIAVFKLKLFISANPDPITVFTLKNYHLPVYKINRDKRFIAITIAIFGIKQNKMRAKSNN